MVSHGSFDTKRMHVNLAFGLITFLFVKLLREKGSKKINIFTFVINIALKQNNI